MNDDDKLVAAIGRAVLDDLEDRRGIKREFRAVRSESPDICHEIAVAVIAARPGDAENFVQCETCDQDRLRCEATRDGDRCNLPLNDRHTRHKGNSHHWTAPSKPAETATKGER